MTTADIAADLVALCREGKFAESGEKYWADDVVSIEAGAPMAAIRPATARTPREARANGGATRTTFTT